MARKKRLSFKERKEQTLLETLDGIHGTTEAISSQQKQQSNSKPSKQKDTSKQKKATSSDKGKADSGSKQWPHMSGKSKSVAKPKSDSKPKSKSKPVASKTTPEPRPKAAPSKLKTVVYIDGENTFFQLYDQLRRTRKVKYREDLVKYDLRWLIEHALGEQLNGSQLRYYGVRLKEIDSTPQMLERTKRMIDHKNRWSGWLSSQGFDYIAAGELRIRATDSHRGSEPNLTFEEKGVDVQMAVEMVDDAATGRIERAILLSSDRDLQPAIQTAQKHDVKVVYITHDQRANDSIVGVVDQTSTFTSADVTEGFSKAN